MAISPDGRFVVSGWSTLQIWDMATRAESVTITGHAGRVSAFAISPDGRLIFSVGEDGIIKIWDAATGAQRCSLPVLGALTCLALHPAQPFLFCGDGGGYFLDVIGVDYEALVVTPVDRGTGTRARCPACREELALRPEMLGQVVRCQTPGCSSRLRVNPFVTRLSGR